MKTLAIEGVRCFRERHELPIRPVTLLVGENSSGKSTVLAMARAAWDLASGREPEFNQEPFLLGGYDAIAHRGEARTSASFQIGALFEESVGRELRSREILGRFSERHAQPLLDSWEGTLDGATFTVRRSTDGRMAIARGKRGVIQSDGEASLESGGSILAALGWLRPATDVAKRGTNTLPLWWTPSEARPVALAPVRSRPRRTYDPTRAQAEPEGSHVPMLLALLSSSRKKAFVRLVEHIGRHAESAGLFSGLNVKQTGRLGDPFQILIQIEDQSFNLMDVGYGVSQVLPILVDTLNAPDGQTFLLQQPEVHLHPRAQAALGSLFVAQAIEKKQTFIVETHSDHLVDRVRMDVRDGRRRRGFSHRDVVILYFERRAGNAAVHPIFLDERGNLVKAPDRYREFFLEEERRLLGIH